MTANSPVAVLRIAALTFVLVAPLVLNAYWLFLALQVVVYTYLALSFDLAYSYSRLLSFCQGLFFTLAAYVATYVASSAGWGLPAMLLGGTLGAALLGAVVGLMLMRMHTHAAIIATVIIAAASLLVGNALSAYTGGDDGLSLPTEQIGIGLWQMHSGLNLATYYLAAVPLVVLICGLWRMRGTLTWTVIRAVAQNDVRARQLGYNVTLRRYAVFVASTAVAGFGGALYALVMNHVTTGLLDISVSVNAILYAVIGGLETDCGALVGALLVLPVTELIASVFTYVQIFVGLLLAVMAVAAPKGIVGTLLQHTSRSRTVQKTEANDDGAPSDGLVRPSSI
ncbi:branched-chain amino acid ABC transporter permease [Bradyrhizobium sp. dw_78]|uniref:branched-chain amino acid ABC transporter permease n=1 Tax=Bradyrhizobium sp. dw_78 TaxID=2719793 RepID=UPI001BD25A14|nr:branched-chain amino acid ABC transporter permease [Bradyrhizobium sp. dw_78]